LAVYVYEALAVSRDFGLRGQMQRSAVSIPSNIAEGHERSAKDFRRFLNIAKGSAAELRTQAYIAAKIGALSNEQKNHIVDETKQLSRMMQSLSERIKLKTENCQLKTEN